MILVIDVNKGIQTQTAECLVIGEITNDKMIIVLNKVDMIPEAGRAEKLAKIEARIRKTLGANPHPHPHPHPRPHPHPHLHPHPHPQPQPQPQPHPDQVRPSSPRRRWSRWRRSRGGRRAP